MNQNTDTARFALLAGEAGFDPIEERLRTNVRATIEAVFEEELASFLGRLRYDRGVGPTKGYRHGHRERQLTGTFGTETVRVPRARVEDETGKVTEWRSKALPRYQRLTKKAEALIAAVCLSGTNTRRVKRALFGLFRGGREQGCGQPRLAQGEGGLRCLVRPQPRRRGHRPSDPRRHRDPDAAGPQGHEHLGAGGRPLPGRALRSHVPGGESAATARKCCYPSETWAAIARP